VISGGLGCSDCSDWRRWDCGAARSIPLYVLHSFECPCLNLWVLCLDVCCTVFRLREGSGWLARGIVIGSRTRPEMKGSGYVRVEGNG